VSYFTAIFFGFLTSFLPLANIGPFRIVALCGNANTYILSFTNAESPPDDASWSSTPTPPRTDPSHQVPRLLLLSMLAIAARYTTKNVEGLPPKGQMWEGGCSYLNDARELLSTLQSVILLLV
jgi:hypothetical protein